MYEDTDPMVEVELLRLEGIKSGLLAESEATHVSGFVIEICPRQKD